MAEKTLPDNEYANMPPDDAVAVVSEMIDRHEREGERAFALAIALRDRLEAQPEEHRDHTGIELAGMLIDQLEGSPGHSIKQCLHALLGRCSAASCAAGGAAGGAA